MTYVVLLTTIKTYSLEYMLKDLTKVCKIILPYIHRSLSIN
jgi:hypothetical protein